MTRREGAIAVHRFGMGARPGELSQAARDPKTWLLEQVSAEKALPEQLQGFPDTASYYVGYVNRYRQRGEWRRQQASVDPESDDYARLSRIIKRQSGSFAAYYREAWMLEFAARFNAAAMTTTPFRERLIRFWSNHLVVPVAKQPVLLYVGSYEREVIRPHIAGRFSDMLKASAQHPGMLIFLDNDKSVGPNSRFGRKNDVGLNENLAREILELHTLGVDGGYTQDDVIALAKGISGWSIARVDAGDGNPGTFHFKRNMHEPGPVTLLGKTYREDGVARGEQMLDDLAHHPATARFLATKLARHFVDDEPSEQIVSHLANVYLEHDTDLGAMTRALVARPEAWTNLYAKLRQPEDYVTTVMRALGRNLLADEVERPGVYDFEQYEPRTRRYGFLYDNRENFPTPAEIAKFPRHAQVGIEIVRMFNLIMDMGQTPMAAPGPQGWYDRVSDWSGADSIMKRVEFGVDMAHRSSGNIEPDVLVDETLGPIASDDLRRSVSRAADKAQGLALLLTSPEFQRR